MTFIIIAEFLVIVFLLQERIKLIEVIELLKKPEP